MFKCLDLKVEPVQVLKGEVCGVGRNEENGVFEDKGREFDQLSQMLLMGQIRHEN